MSDPSKVSLGGEALKGTTAKLLMALSGFVGMIIFARVLGISEFGGYYLLFTVVKVADRPIAGWGIASKKRFSEHESPRSQIVGAQFGFIAAWLLIAIVSGALFDSWLRSYTGLNEAYLLFVVLIASITLYFPFEQLVHAQGRIGAAIGIDTLRSYLTFPLQVGLVLLGLGATGMAFGLAGASLLTLPVLWYYIRIPPSIPSRSTIRSLWEYARYSIPSSIFGKAYSELDLLLLGFLISPAASGRYTVAANLTMAATFLAEASGSGLMAQVSNRASKGSDVSETVSNTMAFVSILAIPIFFGALALPEQLVVTFFGAEYAGAGTMVIGLALYRIVQTQSAMVLQTINGLDLPDVNMRFSALTLVFNIVAGVFLTLWIGAIGVVVATILAEALRYLVLASVLKRRLPEIRLLPRTLLQQFGAAVVMFLVVGAAHTVIPVRSWLHLAVLLAIGAATYGLLLLAISSQLRLTIGSVLRGSRVERFVPRRILNW